MNDLVDHQVGGDFPDDIVDVMDDDQERYIFAL